MFYIFNSTMNFLAEGTVNHIIQNYYGKQNIVTGSAYLQVTQNRAQKGSLGHGAYN